MKAMAKKMALQSFLYFAWMLDFPIERQRKRVTQPFCRCSRHAFSCGDKHRRQSQGQRQGQRHGQRQGQHAERALSCRNGYSVFFSANTAFYHGGIGVFSAKMANIMGTNIRGNVRDNVRGNTLKWRFPVEINTAFFLGKYGVLSWRNRRFLGQNGKYNG